ncbi:MAG: hypothetical protein ACTH1D_05680 [Mycobacteriaceae bacterium]|uniref:hypothetical protein n=1 Tax=Corynebacterium sp. TaxID=1720 RepID=UPI003F979757
MPNKTIYISDDDRDLFDRAAEIAGGFSPAVAEALRQYVDSHELAERGYEQVEVTTRINGVESVKVFRGRRLARVEQFLDGRSVQWTSYATPRDNIAVVRTESPDFIGMAHRGADAFRDYTGFNPRTLFSGVDDLGGLFSMVDGLAKGRRGDLASAFQDFFQGMQSRDTPSRDDNGPRGFGPAVPLVPEVWDPQHASDNDGHGAGGPGEEAGNGDPARQARFPGSSELEVFGSTAELREAAFREGGTGLPVSFITATEQGLETPPVEVLDI